MLGFSIVKFVLECRRKMEMLLYYLMSVIVLFGFAGMKKQLIIWWKAPYEADIFFFFV